MATFGGREYDETKQVFLGFWQTSFPTNELFGASRYADTTSYVE